jgi:hypothetical protein
MGFHSTDDLAGQNILRTCVVSLEYKKSIYRMNQVSPSLWKMHFSDFILVGCILLRYLYTLHKHTTQKLYICDPQMQLNNFFTLLKNFTTCFGPCGPPSGDIFEHFLLYCDTSIIFTSVRLSTAS